MKGTSEGPEIEDLQIVRTVWKKNAADYVFIYKCIGSRSRS